MRLVGDSSKHDYTNDRHHGSVFIYEDAVFAYFLARRFGAQALEASGDLDDLIAATEDATRPLLPRFPTAHPQQMAPDSPIRMLRSDSLLGRQRMPSLNGEGCVALASRQASASPISRGCCLAASAKERSFSRTLVAVAPPCVYWSRRQQRMAIPMRG